MAAVQDCTPGHWQAALGCQLKNIVCRLEEEHPRAAGLRRAVEVDANRSIERVLEEDSMGLDRDMRRELVVAWDWLLHPGSRSSGSAVHVRSRLARE